MTLTALPRGTRPDAAVGAWEFPRIERGRFRLRLAATEADLDAVLRLRYEVFNRELGEGLAVSHATGRDEDGFDRVCDHLMVEERFAGEVVGTYRMQTEEMAARGEGFYTAGEFDLGAVPPPVLSASVEVGRACISPPYRNLQTLFLLWQGLAAYASGWRKRYLFGCCSLTSQDPREGWRAYRDLARDGHLHPEIQVRTLPPFACGAPFAGLAAEGEAPLPTLFRTYLRYGAKVCGPPAIDREFGTIDFLTLLDTAALDARSRRNFFGA
jgi:putative hemolysin